MPEKELMTGIRASLTETVSAENTADSVGSGTLPVYATPSMIALIEKTAVLCLGPFMTDGKASVGTKLDIQHVSASPIGAQVTCETELTEIDGRRLVFTVNVSDNAGIIGNGTHERFIIESGRFMEKAAAKLK